MVRCRPTSASKCGSRTGNDAGAVHDPARELQVVPGRRSTTGRRPAGRDGAHDRPRSISTALPSSTAGTNGSRSDSTVTPCRPAARGQLGQPGPHGQVRDQPRRAQPRRRQRGMTVGHHDRRRQRPGPVAGGRVTTDQELVPGRRSQVDDLVLPHRQHRNHPGGGSPTRTITVRRRASTSRAVTRATHRPSSPAPAPSANRARAARTRPGVGCANASSPQARDLLGACTGRATWRRADRRAVASHGARRVSSGPTRRSTARYVARDRSSARPDRHETLHRVRVQHHLDIKRQPLPYRPRGQPSQHPHDPAQRPAPSSKTQPQRQHNRPNSNASARRLDPLGPVTGAEPLNCRRPDCRCAPVPLSTSRPPIKVLARPRECLPHSPGPPIYLLQ